MPAQQNVAVGVPFTQSFTSLAGGAFTNNSTLPGWYLSTGSITQDNGSSATDGAYVYRAAPGQGTLGARGGGVEFGFRIRNNSSMAVNCIRVSYTGKQWHVGESGGATSSLNFGYATGATVTSLSGGFTSVGGLNFTSPQTNAACGGGGAAVNGNLAANQAAVTFLITGLNLPAGEEIMLKWTATGPGGCAGHGLGIDGLTVETVSLEQAPVTSDATSFSTCSFVADWTAVTEATHYLLDVSTDPLFGSFVPGMHGLNVGNTVTHVVTPVAANTTYYYRVRAVTPCGTTAYSNTSQATTLAFLNTPVSNPASNIGCSGFTANWQPLPGASSYRIDVSTNSSFTAILPAYNNTAVTSTSLNVTGLSLGASYFYRIRAVSDCGVTDNSATQSLVVLSLPPATVANTVTDYTSCSLVARWTEIDGAIGYRLDVNTSNTFASGSAIIEDLDVGNVTSYSITGLNPSTTYYYRLRVVNVCGTSVNSNIISRATAAAFAAPASGVASVLGCTQFQANWTIVSGAPAYELDVATDNLFTNILPAYNALEVTGNNHTVTGLTTNTTYYYRLRTKSSCGVSGNSVVRPATTLPMPGKPDANAALNVSCNGFRANWLAGSSATGYHLFVATDANFASPVTGYNPQVLGNVLLSNLTGLTAGTTYYYRVRAINTCGNGDYSDTISVTTTNLPPSPEPNATSNIQCFQFTASWPAIPGVTSYQMDVSTSPTFASYINATWTNNSAATTTRTVTGLAAGTTYYYRVRAVGCGVSLNSDTIAVVTQPVLDPPTATAATLVANCSFTANWDAMPGATNYFFDLSVSPTFASFIQNNVSVGNVTSRAIAGLTANTPYYYRVRAQNTCGTSANSNVITTLTWPVPTAPATIVFSNQNCNNFDVGWAAVTNATGYRIDVSTVNTFASFVPGYNNLDLGNVTNTTISGLNPGTTYYVRIRAYIQNCATGANSAIPSTATLPMPGVVTALAASNIQCAQFTANWNLLAGVDGYYLDVSTSNTFATFLLQNHDVGNVNSFDVTGLSLNTTYYYRLRGYNSCGVTLYTATFSALTRNIPGTITSNVPTNLLCYSMQANWTAPAVTVNSPTSYLLQVSRNNAFTDILPGYDGLDVGNVTNHVLTSLDPGTTYYYRVKGVNACGESVSWSTVRNGTTQNFLLIPVALAPVATTIRSCDFTARWNAVTGALSYRLDVSTDPDFGAGTFVGTFEDLDVGNVTTRAVAGLAPNTPYYYRVRAVNDCGTTDNSNVISVTTLPVPPAPNSLAGTSPTCNSFVANWQTATNATSYRLDVSTDPDFGSFVGTFNNLNVGNVTTRSVTGLVHSTMYYYRVRAVDACGNISENSTVRSITTQTPPPAPNALAADNITNCSFRANWQAVTHVPAVTTYRIDISTSPVFATFLVNDLNLGNVTNYTRTGLTAGTTYYYRIRALNTCGASVHSDTITVTTLNYVEPPVATAATLVTCNSFTANWNAVPGAVGYNLDVSTDPNFGAGTFVGTFNNLNVGNVTTRSVTGLTYGTTYYYRVRARDACVTSDHSNVISLTTDPMPEKVDAQAATDITNCSFTANWTPVPYATGYRIDISTSPTFTPLIVNNANIAGGASSSYATATNLQPNTTYYYRIRPYNACVTNPNHSDTITVVTLPNPEIPEADPATLIRCDGFVANWRTVPNATSYEIQVSRNIGFNANMVVGTTTTPVNVGNVTSYTVPGLTASTTYYYRVRARIGNCTPSGYSNVITVVTDIMQPAPTATAADPVNCHDFTATWTAATNATGYELQVSTNNTFTVAGILPGYDWIDVGNNLNALVSGLNINTLYYYRVRAYNPTCVSAPSNVITVRTLNVPNTPTFTSITNLQCDAMTINFTAAAAGTPATSFAIDVSTNSGFNPPLVYDNVNIGATSPYVVTGLNASTTYWIRIRAVNACGQSGNSAVRNATTITGTLATPTTTAAANTITPCSFIAPWNTVAGTNVSYQIQVARDAAFTDVVTGYNPFHAGAVTSTTVTGLDPSTLYYYRVRAVNPCDTSAYSSPARTATTLAIPAPGAQAAIDVSECSFRARWTVATATLGYRLDVSTDPDFGAGTLVVDNLFVAAGTLNYVVTGLTGGTPYYYRVRSEHACGTSLSNANTMVLTLPNVPTPNSAAATLPACFSFRANWQTAASATGYTLDVSTVSDFSTFVPGYQNLILGAVLLRDVTGLDPGTTYYYRVRAFNACDTSAYSTTQSAVTYTIPTVPVSLAADNLNSCGFRARWNVSTSVPASTFTYWLDISEASDFSTFLTVGATTYNNLNNGTTTTRTITGLTPGGTYYYRVRASNTCGTSASSDVITVTVDPIPAAPVATAATSLTSCQFVANWNATGGLPAPTAYLLDVSTESDFSTFLTVGATTYNGLNNGTTRTRTITGLTPGGTYYYRVRSTNACGTTDNSNVITVTLPALPAAPVPSGPTVLTSCSFTANWAASLGTPAATAYLLDVSTESDFSTFLTVGATTYNGLNTGTTTSRSITGLTPGVTYYYRVRSV
ncbi:MAG: fibronectin type III domain-containing protein, partial [Bacteroidetes bacterium]|nr:fibronectin type III domain-containing protein [Bacteroidota bacterium]